MSINKWVIDPVHSEIRFTVKHLMVSTVTGYFREYHLTATTEGNDFSILRDALLTIDTDSIDTNNEKRDAHLKSADFFNTGEYSQIKFESTTRQDVNASGELKGNLTIGDVTKPVTLKVHPGGIVVDGYGQTKAGFHIETEIKRKDFGLTWGAVTEAGGVVVSDLVKITADIQLVMQM